MIRAASFLVANVLALGHRLRGHDVNTFHANDRIDALYCEDCNRFLWVRE